MTVDFDALLLTTMVAVSGAVQRLFYQSQETLPDGDRSSKVCCSDLFLRANVNILR